MTHPRWPLLFLPVLVALHLNYWMWDDSRLVWGYPANLFYHLVLSLFLSVVMLVLIRRGWPSYLDDD